MTEQNSGNATDLAILRERAKILGIPNYQVKGYPKLYAEVMEAQDQKAEEQKKENERLQQESKEKAKKEKSKPKEQEIIPITNPKTGRIGLYIHTDKKNTIPYNDKGTAYVFLRWQ